MDSKEKLTFKFKFGFKTIKENRKKIKHKRKGKRNLTWTAYYHFGPFGQFLRAAQTFMRLHTAPTSGARGVGSTVRQPSLFPPPDAYTWARNPDVLLHLEATQRGPSSAPWKSDLPPCKFGLTVASLTDSGVHMVHALRAR